VNVEAEYHEETADRGKDRSTGRDAPIIPRAVVDAAAEARRQAG
jgi:hypothetical protein